MTDLMTEQDKQNCVHDAAIAMTGLQKIVSRNPTELAGVMHMVHTILGMLDRLSRYGFMNTENVRTALQITTDMLSAAIEAKEDGTDGNADEMYERVLSATDGKTAERIFVGEFEGHLVLASIERHDARVQWGIVRLVLDDRLVVESHSDGFVLGATADAADLSEQEIAFLQRGDLNQTPPRSIEEAVQLARRFLADVLGNGL